MITAVDTNVLLDLLIPDSLNVETAQRQLDEASEKGQLILSEVVVADLAAHFPNAAVLETFLADTRLEVLPGGQNVWFRAGQIWGYTRKPAKECRGLYKMWPEPTGILHAVPHSPTDSTAYCS